MIIKIINPKISRSGKSMNFKAEGAKGWFYAPIRFTNINELSDIEKYNGVEVEIDEDKYRVEGTWTRIEGFKKINGKIDDSKIDAYRKLKVVGGKTNKSKKDIKFKETLISVDALSTGKQIEMIVKHYAVENDLDMRKINGMLMIKDPNTMRFCKFSTFITKYVSKQ